MLLANNRIRKDKEIRTVLQKGKGCYGGLFGLRVMSNSLTNNRFALVISNKVSKKAVKRNRLRRQLWAVIRSNLAKFKENNDIIILVRPKTDILKINFADIKEETEKMFKKANILK